MSVDAINDPRFERELSDSEKALVAEAVAAKKKLFWMPEAISTYGKGVDLSLIHI